MPMPVVLALGLALACCPSLAAAQDIQDLATGALGGVGQNAVILLVGMTILSLAPGLAIMVTCFPFIVTVLSVLRQSIGLQQAPPNMLIVSLAMFLSWYVMDPVLRDAWDAAGAPLQRGEITLDIAFERGVEPFRRFMAERVDPDTMMALADVAPMPAGAQPGDGLSGAGQAGEGQPAASMLDPQTAPLSLLVPSFMLTEVDRKSVV